MSIWNFLVRSDKGIDAGHSPTAIAVRSVLEHGEVSRGTGGYVVALSRGSLISHEGWFEVGGKMTNRKLVVDHASFTAKNRG